MADPDEIGPSVELESRIRTLTDKGYEQYHSRVGEFVLKISAVRSDVTKLFTSFEDYAGNSHALRDIQKQLLHGADKHYSLCREFMEYLERTKTKESQTELDHVRHDLSDFDNNVRGVVSKIETLQTEISVSHEQREHDRVSQKSRHTSVISRSTKSHNSKMSTVSSAIAAAKAKAEAARVRAEFTEREADILKQKALLREKQVVDAAKTERKDADLTVDLQVLASRREAAAIKAEAEALQSELEDPSNESFLSFHRQPVDSKSRTEAYVKEVQNDHNNLPLLNPSAKPFFPCDAPKQKPNPDSTFLNQQAVEFTRFLLKKELLFSRFVTFNDKAEFYPSWKSSFKNILSEIQVSPSEEIDLLLKWTQSKLHVQSICAANSHQPEVGRCLIWKRLDERYGSPELIEHALNEKLLAFPKVANKDVAKLYDLADILSEIVAIKEDKRYSSVFAYFDSSIGVSPIVSKLPYDLQGKWTTRASKYKDDHNVSFPPFTFFADFIREMSRIKNDPGFKYENTILPAKSVDKEPIMKGMKILSRKTNTEDEIMSQCPVHNSKSHSLNECRTFKNMPWDKRKQYLRENAICFRCCASRAHISKNCKMSKACTECGNSGHATAMHIPKPPAEKPQGDNGGEKLQATPPNKLTSKCTTICGSDFTGRSCAKIVLVNVFSRDNPENVVRVYAVLDDQSNRTLGKSALLDHLNPTCERSSYSLSSCAGNVRMSGRKACNLVVQSLDGKVNIDIPSVIECDQIPDDRSEIPTPEVATHHQHLKQIAHCIPQLDPNASIQLLIGRDIPEAHIVQQQVIGSRSAPFAQKLDLGWVVIGEVCLGKIHSPDYIQVKKTQILKGGRGSIFNPCKNRILIKEDCASQFTLDGGNSILDNVFFRDRDDNNIGLSVEDKEFISLMESTLHKTPSEHWEAPLPFKQPKPSVPNNRSLALRRALTLDLSLKRDCTKREHFVAFMNKVLSSGAAEVAPPLPDKHEVNYLPIFGVYHPKKPHQIRGVFESSAVFEGISLNSLLMCGPDLTNNLLAILLRFRKDKVAISADIEQMFYQFYVNEEHRDFLRFFWYMDNDPSKPLIEYRMCVHVFGNSPSPAIATFGLRKSVEKSDAEVSNFVRNNFYVDDALTSLTTTSSAIDLLQKTCKELKSNGKLRLHKIASNDKTLLKAFPKEDLASELQGLDLDDSSQELPLHASLGLPWLLNKDCFVFILTDTDKPFTRRGLLSMLNGIFDPMGFISPFVIGGKILLREMSTKGIDWDDLLPSSYLTEWQSWKQSLLSLNGIEIPRMFIEFSVSDAMDTELHIFSDASEKAIAAVGYIVCIDSNGKRCRGFVMGKSKLAPLSGHTIPRLELCAAVLATELCEVILNSLEIKPTVVRYYTDSKVVLGYLYNTTRRFYTYVCNRVDRIRQYSDPQQWQYVPSQQNPADLGTRFLSVPKDSLKDWLSGPRQLSEFSDSQENVDYQLHDPTADREIRPEVSTNKTTIQSSISDRFERFSQWELLVSAFSLLRRIARVHAKGSCNADLSNSQWTSETQMFIIKSVQNQFYGEEIDCLQQHRDISRTSVIHSLNPFLDEDGVLRVGGRLKHSPQVILRHPIIIPGKSHVAKLIIIHSHEAVKHQGRLFTQGAVRDKGFWIVGAKRIVSSVIHKCVTCRKLRGSLKQQQMANLPTDRVTPGPPFTSVGVDVFGPWSVVTRRTRGGSAQSKRWAVLFSCLTTRAVHIEIIEEMSSSSFINALRRFVALRGSVKVFRSDRGTNFVGSIDELRVDAVFVEGGPIRDFLSKNGTTWIFNPPHASHRGGRLERMIGITRRILDAMLLDSKCKQLTHEVLTTFMAEVTAIMNSRPITCLSTDQNDPLIMCPNLLLTQKHGLDPVPVLCDGLKDIYKAQWKHVQVLSDIFWKKWRDEYLSQLQQRRKWQSVQPDLKLGDVVLLRDKTMHRNSWPLGLITKVYPSESDGKIRTVEIRVCKDKCVTYTRPISELVLLVD